MKASTAKMKNFIEFKKLFTFDEGLKKQSSGIKKEKICLKIFNYVSYLKQIYL